MRPSLFLRTCRNICLSLKILATNPIQNCLIYSISSAKPHPWSSIYTHPYRPPFPSNKNCSILSLIPLQTQIWSSFEMYMLMINIIEIPYEFFWWVALILLINYMYLVFEDWRRSCYLSIPRFLTVLWGRFNGGWQKRVSTQGFSCMEVMLEALRAHSLSVTSSTGSMAALSFHSFLFLFNQLYIITII